MDKGTGFLTVLRDGSLGHRIPLSRGLGMGRVLHLWRTSRISVGCRLGGVLGSGGQNLGRIRWRSIVGCGGSWVLRLAGCIHLIRSDGRGGCIVNVHGSRVVGLKFLFPLEVLP